MENWSYEADTDDRGRQCAAALASRVRDHEDNRAPADGQTNTRGVRLLHELRITLRIMDRHCS